MQTTRFLGVLVGITSELQVKHLLGRGKVVVEPSTLGRNWLELENIMKDVVGEKLSWQCAGWLGPW